MSFFNASVDNKVHTDDVVAIFCVLTVSFRPLRGKWLPALTEQIFQVFTSFPSHLCCY